MNTITTLNRMHTVQFNRLHFTTMPSNPSTKHYKNYQPYVSIIVTVTLVLSETKVRTEKQNNQRGSAQEREREGGVPW